MNSILFKVLPAPALSARALPPSLCVLPPLALSVRGSARLYACGSAWLCAALRAGAAAPRRWAVGGLQRGC